MSKAIFVRGISGSGKSTYAKELLDKGEVDCIVEADQFFMENGKYCFNSRKVSEAHEWAKSKMKLLLKQGKNVVVANTFTRLWELEGYMDIASQITTDLEVIRMESKYTNIHGVSEDVVKMMKERFEDYKGEKIIY